jgi:hypothetical protein
MANSQIESYSCRVKRHHSPLQKSRPFARAQVVQLHMRNYAVRFGLILEADAERFFAFGAQPTWRSIHPYIATQPA